VLVRTQASQPVNIKICVIYPCFIQRRTFIFLRVIIVAIKNIGVILNLVYRCHTLVSFINKSENVIRALPYVGKPACLNIFF